MVVLTMVGVWVCSWWRERERDKGGRKKEKIKEEILFFWLCILVDNIYYFNE